MAYIQDFFDINVSEFQQYFKDKRLGMPVHHYRYQILKCTHFKKEISNNSVTFILFLLTYKARKYKIQYADLAIYPGLNINDS